MNNLLKVLAAITMVLVSTASAVFILKAERPPSPAPAATLTAAAAPAPALVPAPAAPVAPVAAAPAPAAPAPAAPAPDNTPGDSSVITTSAWQALTDEKYDDAVTAAQKCINLYKQQALDEQKSLKAPVPTSDKDGVNKLWALNDVGTCYFILGQAYEKQNKPKDATAAYQYLVDNLSYSQCWDPQGWFWRPSAAAQKQLKSLKGS